MEDAERYNQKSYKQSRLLYHAEAALEYLISNLVGGTFLARLTDYLGFSDSLTGVLSAIISLGAVFQLLSSIYRKPTVKRFVIALSVINQLLFFFLYVIPLIFPKTAVPALLKTVCFAVTIVLAYLLYNIAFPKKINWFMSLVSPDQLGTFTATKEIISLISSMIFTFAMGCVIDHYQAISQMRTAFLICGIAIFVITVLHTLTMIFSTEPTVENVVEQKNSISAMLAVARDPKIRRITILFTMYAIANYSTLSFLGTYQNKELGLSQSLIVIISSVFTVSRIIMTRVYGRYADRHSFSKMVGFCLVAAMLSFASCAVATPKNGVIAICFYQFFSSAAGSGIGSAQMNMILESTAPQNRSDALALCYAVSGVCGFLTTLLFTPLVSYIQNNGNRLFGMPIYAQQVTSAIAVILMGLTFLYLQVAIRAKEKKDSTV